MHDGFLKVPTDANLPVACQGSLDEITAGLRVIPAVGKDLVSAGVGRKLVLRGWIGSKHAKDNGITVRMTSKVRKGPFLEFQVKTEMRPDVAACMAQSLMEWGGFEAEAIVPNDFPLGRYKILVECRKASSRHQFAPEKEIAVVSAKVGAAPDLPMEKERRQKEKVGTQAARPIPSVTPEKKSKRRCNATVHLP